MVCDIAGGPELIESMDGSAGNYRKRNSVKRVQALSNMVGHDPSTDGSSQRKWGLRSHTDLLRGDQLAAQVEGGFGDDFVRRNRSQLRHTAKCLW
jgi:hypothetical protein